MHRDEVGGEVSFAGSFGICDGDEGRGKGGFADGDIG